MAVSTESIKLNIILLDQGDTCTVSIEVKGGSQVLRVIGLIFYCTLSCGLDLYWQLCLKAKYGPKLNKNLWHNSKSDVDIRCAFCWIRLNLNYSARKRFILSAGRNIKDVFLGIQNTKAHHTIQIFILKNLNFQTRYHFTSSPQLSLLSREFSVKNIEACGC